MIQNRKIIHIDMDAFYASVEQRDNPELKGKPVAVGGSGKRGVVAAASYEAREYGIHSAMPSVTALRKCPHLIFVKARFDVYRKVSAQIRDIFFSYTDLVEPLSLDEAYLDVTENKKDIPSGTLIAEAIRAEIFEQTQLTASAGISFNKFLAKIASDLNKPNGLSVITPKQAHAFLENLAIEKFHGIGKKTAEKMHRLGIYKGKDLKAKGEEELMRHFGKPGRFFYKMVRAEDNRMVKPNRIRKSLSAENTFFNDLHSKEEMIKALEEIAVEVTRRLAKAQTKGKTLTLKIKYSDFTLTSRSKTMPYHIHTYSEIMEIVRFLLEQPELPPKPVRLFGIGLSNLDTEKKLPGIQLYFDF